MGKDEMIDAVRFAKAEISPMPEYGFILVSLHHWEKQGTEMAVRSGQWHALPPGHVEDLIGHLQHALAQYRNPKAPTADVPTQH